MLNIYTYVCARIHVCMHIPVQIVHASLMSSSDHYISFCIHCCLRHITSSLPVRDRQVYEHAHKLTCQYRRHHPMFYINPLREEVMYLDPRIVVFHNLITDAEIAKVKELAKPRVSETETLICINRVKK